MPLARRALNRNAALLLGAGFLILIAVGAASLYLVQRTRVFADGAAELGLARVSVGRLLDQMQAAETGQRGYLLTGDLLYLQPYRDAADKVPGSVKDLGSHLARLPDGNVLQARIAQAAADKLAELQQTVALERAGRHDDAMRIVRTDRGKQLMDEVTGLLNRVARELDARGAADRAGLFSLVGSLLYASWGGLILVVLVAAAAANVLARYTGEVDRARRAVEAANASLETRVQERTADLAAANEEVQRFAYIVSHDLRAPLVNVMGFTAELETALGAVRGLLAEAGAKAPELVTADARIAIEEDLPEALGFIRTSTVRMDRLINAILKLSREGRRTLTPERVAMTELFSSIATSIQHQLDEASAEITVTTPMPDAVSDRLALEQVFGNLVDNAVKYLDPSRPGRVAISGRAEGGGLRYDIEDNGRGIAPRDRERVFELFRRAGVQDRPGEGIGLAHVRALVRRLGGTIDFTSEPGRGTAFTVRLPRDLPANGREPATT